MTPAHLCLVHPLGDRSALGLLDVALALKAELEDLGVTVSLARQRLRADAVNLVLGAEHGFDADAARGHCCVLVNTVPLRDGGGRLPAAALRQLKRFPVVDVDPASLSVLRPEGLAHAPPVATWLPGPARHAAPGLALQERPIALLLASPPSARQAALLAGMAQAGIGVARLDQTLAGPELAAMLGQARAVLCLLPEDDAPPDLLAISLALRAGTPVLAERPGDGRLPDAPPAAAVMWFEPSAQGLMQVLRGGADSPAFIAAGQACLDQFRAQAPAEPARALWTLAQAQWALHQAAGHAPQRPDRLCLLAAGQPRRPGWWHVADQPSAAIDQVLDLNQPLSAEALAATGPGRWQLVDAGSWHPKHTALPAQALRLLAPGGRLVLKCALQDLPGLSEAVRAHGGAANAASAASAAEAAVAQALAPWTSRFWLAGLLNQRLALDHLGWLDATGLPVAPAEAATVRVVLLARDTSYQERSQARAMSPDFGLSLA